MKILLEAEGRLYRSCQQSQLSYTFQLNHNVKALFIDFSYGPKEIRDKKQIQDIFGRFVDDYNDADKERFMTQCDKSEKLTNLLTLSLDDCYGFRGAAHRGSASQDIFINREDATVGFIPGEIPQGLCTLTVSAHAILTEHVDYKISIQEG